MNQNEIKFSRDLAVAQYIHDQLYAFNLRHTGDEKLDIKLDPADVGGIFYVSNADAPGGIAGGIVFKVVPEGLYADYFWLSDLVRGQGLGVQVMTALKDYAVSHGYKSIGLHTAGYQAPKFYEKNGFELQSCDGEPNSGPGVCYHYIWNAKR
ncbi:MAG: GNAT family N-acetyltransferase [Victivallaceae bacterium]